MGTNEKYVIVKYKNGTEAKMKEAIAKKMQGLGQLQILPNIKVEAPKKPVKKVENET